MAGTGIDNEKPRRGCAIYAMRRTRGQGSTRFNAAVSRELMLQRSLPILLVFAFANQTLWCLAASRGVLLHRHGAFGLHLHMLGADDRAEIAADSANWGHVDAPAVEPASASDVIILLFAPGNHDPLSSAGPDDLTSQRFLSFVELSPIALPADVTPRFAVLSQTSVQIAPGHAPGVRGILESSHSLLI